MSFRIFSKNKIAIILSALLLVISCKSDVKRYIDSNDMSYSNDVRSISERINNAPSNADLYYKRANTFYFEGNFKEAIEDINVAIDLNPDNGFYYFKLGEFYMAGDTADALLAEKAYKKSIELEPNSEEARIKYSILLLAKQKYIETAQQLRAALEINPSNADALFYIGLANKEAGDTAQAIRRFQEAVDVNNTYFNAYVQLAMLFMENEPDMALKYIDNAIRVDEFSDEAHYVKGLILEDKEEYTPAIEFYKRTIELNPEHRFAYYRLAYINAEIEQKYTKAIEYLDKLLNIDDEFVPALHFRGAIYKRLFAKEKARADWERALQLEPDNEDVEADLNELL